MLTSGRYSDRVTALKRMLHTRLELHRWEGREGAAAYRLDLRTQDLRGGRMTLYDPSDPDWPARGTTTTSLPEALAWVDEYVDRQGLAYFSPRSERDLVGPCAARFLADLKVTKGDDSSTFRNRTSAVRVHILPALGDESLLSLTEESVQTFLDALRTTEGKVPAPATVEGVLATLNGIWHFAYPKQASPWDGKVTVSREDAGRARRERALSGERLHRGAEELGIEQLRKVLIASAALDIHRARKPSIIRGILSTLDHVAFLVYHPTRVEEGTFLRPSDVDRDLQAICLPGTKSHAAERWVTIQDPYMPWLQRLMSAAKSDTDYLLPGRAVTRRARPRAISEAVSLVLSALDLKRPGECTKVFRSAHLSLALGAGMTDEHVAALGGHDMPNDRLLTNPYLMWRAFLAGLPPLAWRYMPDLGHPDEIMGLGREALRTGSIRFDGDE